ncbi:hypothetical protein Pfo_012432 [Paulownia fortunei]|nr:hypothetical protein Pfo_012432 [Paulownia fortunei]
MGHHCCSKQKVKRGLWSPEEDEKLVRHITTHGHGCWSSVPKLAGLQRCGKSCRLRWINYLRPDLKRGSFTEQEERTIIDVHRILGNRTDNEVKNFWNSCIKKKLIAQGLDPNTHNLLSSSGHHQPASRITKNNTTCNATKLNSSFQHTFTVDTTPTSTTSCAAAVPIDMKTLVPNIINPHPNSHYTTAALNDQNPSSLISSCDHHNSLISALEFARTCSRESTPMFSSSSGFSILNDNCTNWGAGIEFPFDQQSEHQTSQAQQPQQQQICEGQVYKVNHDHQLIINSGDKEAGNTFDGSTNFDFEFVDSALLPPPVYNCSVNSMDDQLAWDC